MRLALSTGLAVAATAAWLGCGSGGGSEAAGAGAGSPAGPGGTGATTGTAGTGPGTTGSAGAAGGAVPVFEDDIVPLFAKSCGAGDNACHSRVAYAATANQGCRGWLALEDVPLGSVIYAGPDQGAPTGCPDMPLYDRLLELDAWMCTDTLRRYVIPCDVENSYMARKIDGGPYCLDGDGMPSDPMPPDKLLDPVERETILAWIAGGAPRADGTKVDCGGGAGGAGGGGRGPQDPVPSIWHPGDMEVRPAGVPILFKGAATDPQEGDLPVSALVWKSDQIGQLGTGTDFEAPLPAGDHVVTLEATDSDANVGSTSITLYIQ